MNVKVTYCIINYMKSTKKPLGLKCFMFGYKNNIFYLNYLFFCLEMINMM